MDGVGQVSSKARSRMSEAGLKMSMWVCLHVGFNVSQSWQVLPWEGGPQLWVLSIRPASSAQHFLLKYTMLLICSISIVRTSCEWVKVLSALFCPGYQALSDAGGKAVFKSCYYWVVMQEVLVYGCSNFSWDTPRIWGFLGCLCAYVNAFLWT